MNDELDNFQLQGSKNVPNGTAVLVLGILSIVMCWTYGVLGIVLGIVALVLHKKDKAVYLSNPSVYEQSFKNSKAGFICAIIGISTSVLFLIYIVALVVFFSAVAISTVGGNLPEFQEAMQQLSDSLNYNQ